MRAWFTTHSALVGCLLVSSIFLCPAALADTTSDLEKLETSLKRNRPEQRHYRADNIIEAALLVHGLADKTARTAWGERLFGTGTKAAQAFTVLDELLAGRFDRLLELPDLLTSVRWYELADRLEKAGRDSVEQSSWNDAAAALYLLEICTRSGLSSGGRRAIKALQETRDDLRKTLLGTVTRIGDDDKHSDKRRQLCYAIQHAARQGLVTHPEWCKVASDLATRPDEHRTLIEGLRRAKLNALAADAALRALERFPTDTYVIRTGFEALIQADRGKDAFEVILDAEMNTPYPAKRHVRLHYLNWLRTASYRHRSGKPLPPEIMTFAEEREDRQYVAAVSDDSEAQMAVADVYMIEGKRREAAGIYRSVCMRTTQALLKWTAWIAWAESDPAAAWHNRAIVKESVSAPRDEIDSYRSLVNHYFAVGLAAGETETALTWAEQHLDVDAKDAKDAELVTALAVIWCANGDQDRATALLEAFDNESVHNNVFSRLLRVPHGIALSGLGISPGLLRAVSAEHRSRFNVRETWPLAARLAIELIPSTRTTDRLRHVWQELTTEFPVPASPGADSLHGQVTEACLAWMDAHPKDDSALYGMLSAASYTLARARHAYAAELSLSMFRGCLERAAKREVRVDVVRSNINYVVRDLANDKLPDAVGPQVRAAIEAHYPALLR